MMYASSKVGENLSPQVKTMLKLGMTEAEIADILEADKRIDRGEKLFELDPELEAGAKKARQADRKANSEPVKRERKANDDKRTLIEVISNAVNAVADEAVEVTNIEREMVFRYKGAKYKIVLSAPRS